MKSRRSLREGRRNPLSPCPGAAFAFRAMRFPLLRSRALWFGVPTLLFLLWAWVDSTRNQSWLQKGSPWGSFAFEHWNSAIEIGRAPVGSLPPSPTRWGGALSQPRNRYRRSGGRRWRPSVTTTAGPMSGSRTGCWCWPTSSRGLPSLASADGTGSRPAKPLS